MISSELQSQLFSKIAAWEILVYKYAGEFWYRTAPPDLRVEVYTTCVYVHLPKTDYYRGISTFLSFWDFLDRFMNNCLYKASRVQVFLERSGKNGQQFTVTSSQGAMGDRYRVILNRWGGRCTCKLFLCFGNRIRRELPYCFRLLMSSHFFSGQAICHHIYAALDRGGWNGLASYKHDMERLRRLKSSA